MKACADSLRPSIRPPARRSGASGPSPRPANLDRKPGKAKDRPSAAATWMTGTYDPELDTIYWPIGNPGPDLMARSPGRQPLLRFGRGARRKDRQLKWHFQFTPHDV